jgi:transposase InsO family protein
MQYQNLIVVGGGQAGRRAAEVLRERAPDARICIIDRWATEHMPASQSSPARESSDTPQIGIAHYVPALRNLIVGYRAGGVQSRALHPMRYIERFYNSTRRHSTLGYVSPMEFMQARQLA